MDNMNLVMIRGYWGNYDEIMNEGYNRREKRMYWRGGV